MRAATGRVGQGVSPRFLDCGDAALTIEFGNAITPELVAQVAALEHAVGVAQARGELAGLIEAVPTFRSLTLMYDPLRTSRALLDPALRALLDETGVAATAPPRHWRMPACYGGEPGADLADVAAATGLSAADVVALHAASTFTVYMLGFMPGFAFMGGLPEALAMPRRREPRVRVPAGTLAITGPLTAVYPWESPGGWQLIGHCPVPLFDARAAQPVLLAPGDRVRFEETSAARCAELARALRAGELNASAFAAPAA